MALAASVIVGLAVAWGCGDDENKTPKCSPLSLYDLREYDASDPEWQAIKDERAAADDLEGCVTKPGTATTAAAGAPGSGGSAGAGGSSGGTAGAGGTSDAAAD